MSCVWRLDEKEDKSRFEQFRSRSAGRETSASEANSSRTAFEQRTILDQLRSAQSASGSSNGNGNGSTPKVQGKSVSIGRIRPSSRFADPRAASDRSAAGSATSALPGGGLGLGVMRNPLGMGTSADTGTWDRLAGGGKEWSELKGREKVIFEDACKRINRSEEIRQHLLPPLKFHSRGTAAASLADDAATTLHFRISSKARGESLTMFERARQATSAAAIKTGQAALEALEDLAQGDGGPGTYTSADVWAKLEKDANGTLQYVQLYADIPSSGAGARHRVWIIKRKGDVHNAIRPASQHASSWTTAGAYD
ncbi:hypothetical protein CBOM_04049 [Ceraceosorus bombacis]|uniref:Uncharacterized protein n=1 Tax=Ceraceosorus bombacis TaxID=401625 RepID=A0A0P1BLP0_9BASI|nr:hypothetical protein CBOM_04049 [Ceraceosorus bombacis]